MRTTATIVIALLVSLALLTGTEGEAEAGSYSAAALERGVLAEVNEVRRRHGLVALRSSAPLTTAAGLHSQAMLRYGFFAHESRDGSAFWKRVGRYYGSTGYRQWAVGENLLWAQPGLTPEAALAMWMASPPHRRNILDPRWREVGLAVVHAPSAPGVFRGREVLAITTDFGTRR